MDNACSRFEHTVTVTVTTQFPNPTIDQLIQQLLGPWCKSAKLVESVDTEGNNG